MTRAPLSPAIADACDWLRQVVPQAPLASDSRRVGPGNAFIAYPGDASDGRLYIADAIERGAAAVLYEQDASFRWDDTLGAIAHRAVPGLKHAAGELASAWYGHPDAGMLTIGVTGTNGKTSCTQWLADALAKLDDAAAVIGTLGVGMRRRGQTGTLEQTGFTTPDAVLLQRKLADLRDAGARSLSIEVSSIGLDQGRLAGMHFDIAVFTNFTRDHLDYHGTMQAYAAAKRRLFDWPGLRHAVINLDDALGQEIVRHLAAHRPEVHVCGYTLQPDVAAAAPAGVGVALATDWRATPGGTAFQLHSPQGSGTVKTRVVGAFNVSNMLAVCCTLLASGHAWDAVVEVLETLAPVPGRMQQIGGIDTPLIVIDYAHTPDALEKTLTALRDVTAQRGGRLWCVFGCGGDRDAGKRLQMGKVAEMADEVIVTSDNPRSEDPADIMAQIAAGMTPRPASATDGARPQCIEDRAQAILRAVKQAGKADVVLLAGKGHESYQEIRGRRFPFLDADHAALALAARVTNASQRGAP